MFRTSTIRRLAAASVVALVATPGLAANVITNNFSSFLVFGDSLSDNGNLFGFTTVDPNFDPTPQSPPYFNGRFSDGPVWNEGIIESFNGIGPAANFAFGGAQATSNPLAFDPNTSLPVPGTDPVPDFTEQVGIFATQTVDTPGGPIALSGLIGDRPLASVWFGANDLFGTIPQASVIGVDLGGAPIFDNTPALDAAALAAFNIGQNIGALNSTFGIEDFVVFNLPDLGQIPLFAGTLLSGVATDATNAFNTALATQILSLQADGINIIEVDANDLFNQLLANPALFGVSDTTTTCVTSDDSGITSNCIADLGLDPTVNGNAERVFFDEVHPTQQIHASLQGEFTSAVAAAVPLPAPVFLLLGALGLLAAYRRQAQA